jgi:hypothetical protein
VLKLAVALNVIGMSLAVPAPVIRIFLQPALLAAGLIGPVVLVAAQF